MKEGDETPKQKELPKVTPIKQELYTKFEDLSKSERIEIQRPEMHKESKIEIIKTESLKPEIKKVEIPKPEIPEPIRKPEMPKPEVFKPVPSPVEVPVSAPQKVEVLKLETLRTETPKLKVETPITQFEQTVKSETVQRTPTPTTPTKFEPLPRYTMKSTTYKQYSSLSGSSQQKYEEFSLTPEPPGQICYEPRKSEEVIEKGKRLQESYEEIASKEIPTTVTKTVPLTTSAKQAFIEESSTRSEFYKSEASGPIYRPSAEIPVRPVSPRPSAEALEMEKLWASQKVIDERPTTTYSYEKQTTTSTSTQPAMDAISMEKMWAHKLSETSVQKSWPPPSAEPTKPAPSWSTQSTLERRWTPSTETTEKESKTVVQESVQTAYDKKWIPASSEKLFQEVKVESLNVPHYVAQVTHEHKVNEQEIIQRSAFAEHKETRQIEVVEEEAAKASDIIKSWPPKPVEREIPYKPTPLIESLPVRPVSVQDITDEVYLEPGPPPEIGFARPPVERTQSYVESVEQEIEKNLEKVPTRVLPGAVRTVPPPPLPPKKELPQAPPLPARVKFVQPVKKVIEIPYKPFERFPDLEPFPFKPDPAKPRPVKCGPPPTPSKFVKGKFTDSDYESDVEAIRIAVKWRPYASDTEEPCYRRVQPPKMKVMQRSRSTEKEPLPPSQFERPPQFEGPPRPVIDFESSKQIRKEAQQIKKQTKHYTKHIQYDTKKEVKKEVSPPDLKPGSPPVFVQPEPKPKPPSPKMKQKIVVDGYMADTDEPFTLRHRKTIKSEHRHEERSEHRQFYQSSHSSTESSIHKTTAPAKTSPPKFTQHKRHTQSTTSAKKELISTPIITSISTTEKIIDHGTKQETLEPFPYQAEPVRPKRVRAPPPPSPSRFVKGEFRESDYESEYEGRIPPVWRPSSAEPEPAYRPVRPDLTPTGRTSQASERVPTPPSQFDVPPQIGTMRPKFEPIEKPKKVVKMEEIVKPIAKPALYKPQPTIAKHEITDIIVATPAAPEKVLQPGTPPEIGYAPGPQKTQYYKSTTSAPYHNAIQTETSNVMHFNEATEHSRRTVSLQQTTKVIKFGDQSKETLQYKTDTDRQRYKGPPPPKPTKFIPGEFRESDYESEVESVRIKAKWVPTGSDTEDIHYRKVRPPPITRASSVPTPQERVCTPMEFDTRPPEMPSKISTESHISEISKRFGETKSSQITKSSDFALQPGSPPEYGYVPEKITKTTATKLASKHMDSMTQSFKSKAQKFVNDIVGDVNKKTAQKPILKAKDDSDAQVYREETRAAQYGTKHVDPDTGLIYFKYDFGYEFGIVLPGESKSGEIPVPKKTIIEPPKRSTDIEMPVYHESSTKPSTNSHQPQFKPKKFTPSNKNVKWEPTSESEMSEYEGESKKKLPGTGARWEQSSCSPVSISPSLPSTSPAFNNYPGSAHIKGTETPPSCPSTPGSIPAHQGLGKRAPLFITPLRDIAVVNGQTARFECIVQSEPPPSILWSKNGRIIENSADHQIFYRNGVCRLTVPRAFPEDAGTYTCTATNQVGAVGTTATLQVPG
ncbi:Immunoglobulin, partial [Oryctes borbonicus]